MVDNPIRQDTLEQEPGAMAYSGLDECYFRSPSSPYGHAIIGDSERIHWRELPACCAGGATEVLESRQASCHEHCDSDRGCHQAVRQAFVAVDGLDLRVPRGSLYGFMPAGLALRPAPPAWPGRALGGPHHPDRDGHRLGRRQDLPHRPADAGQAAQFRRAGPLGDRQNELEKVASTLRGPFAATRHMECACYRVDTPAQSCG